MEQIREPLKERVKKPCSSRKKQGEPTRLTMTTETISDSELQDTTPEPLAFDQADASPSNAEMATT